MSKTIIDFSEIKSLRLEILQHRFFHQVEKGEYLHSPFSHYKLLAYLSTKFNNVKLYDIGTRHGSSAVALSYNPTNTVYTFDVKDYLPYGYQLPGIFRIIENPIQNDYIPSLISASLIFVDIDPHAGIEELQLYTYLIDNKYKGILIFHDVCNPIYPNLNKTWKELIYPRHQSIHESKNFDVGIVDFNNQMEFYE